MHWLYLSALILAWLIALVWTHRALSAAFNLPRIPNLLTSAASAAPQPPVARGPWPVACLTVIVPARNEGAAIEATLRSLLAQTIPLIVLAIDDRSTDATGAIMDRLAAEPAPDGKFLSVIHIETLPPDWTGKNHAMALAARQTSTPWLLFTDGDVLFEPDTLERALRYAEANRVGHLVLMPTLILKTPGERMMAATFQSLSLLNWRPWKIADPRAKHESIGMGAFNLVRGEAYRAIGGFEAFPMEVLEDLRLGHDIKHRGYHQHMVLGRGLIRLHWASGALGMVNNLTKNIYATFRFRPLLLLGAWLGLLLLCGVPIAALFAPWSPRAAGILSLLMIALLYRTAGRDYNGLSAAWVLTLPVSLTLILYAMLRSLILTLARGGIVWRGTFYPLKELRRNLGPLR